MTLPYPTDKQLEACHAVYDAETNGRPCPSLAEIAVELGVARTTCQTRIDRSIELELLVREDDGRLRTADRYHHIRRQTALDVATNPIVTEVTDDDPGLIKDWADFEVKQLYSNRGMGGALTREGVHAKINEINENRHWRHVCELLLINGGVRDRLIHTLDELYNEVQPPKFKLKRKRKKKAAAKK